MQAISPEPTWPPSWLSSYEFDRMEVYGEQARSGYARAYGVRVGVAFDLIKLAAPGAARVLDVAAAQGNITLRLAEQGHDVTWNDLRADLEAYVRLKRTSGSVTYRAGNIFDTDFGEPFDLVVATEVIEHVAHPDRFLRRLAELVRPGGAVVLTTPLGSYLRNELPRFSDVEDPSEHESRQFQPDADGHIFLLHTDEILRLSKDAGFDVRTIRYFNNPLTAGHMKLESLARRLPPAAVSWIERQTQRSPVQVQRQVNSGVGVLLVQVGPTAKP